MKPTGRGYRAPRCEECGLTPDACICSELPKTPSSVTTSFVVHFREWNKPTNTAKLASLLLGQSARVLLRGSPDVERAERAETELESLDHPLGLVLYPSDDAIRLEELIERDGVSRWSQAQLVVPDGTWSQSRRLVRRTPALARLPHIQLGERRSSYHLRRKAEPGFLCTLEAVGYALTLLDPAFDLPSYLAAFEQWQHRALLRRWGKIPDFARADASNGNP
jgi:DTW domain-containing protein YfiP